MCHFSLYMNGNTTHEAFWPVNKRLCSIIGVKDSIYLMELIFRYSCFEKISHDGFFRYGVSEMQKMTGMSLKVQKGIRLRLSDAGIITVKNSGFGYEYRIDFAHDIFADFDIKGLPLGVIKKYNLKGGVSKRSSGVSERLGGVYPKGQVGCIPKVRSTVDEKDTPLHYKEFYKENKEYTTTTKEKSVVVDIYTLNSLSEKIGMPATIIQAIANENDIIHLVEIEKAYKYAQEAEGIKNVIGWLRSGSAFSNGLFIYSDSSDEFDIEYEDKWQQICYRLKKEISNSSYNTWIRPLEASDIYVLDGRYTIIVPDDIFIYELSSGYYKEKMQAAINYVFDEYVEIEFKVRTGTQ